MRLERLAQIRCPVCNLGGRASAVELDAARIGGGEDGGAPGDLVEGFLVCEHCRGAWPVLAGVPILSADLPRHLATHGNVYRRVPIGDPRVTRYVLGQARDGADFVPFAEVVERYGDLLPAGDGPAAEMAEADRALAAALAGLVGAAGPALHVGCGVGRGVFVLAGALGDAIGTDRSVARVRRARNVQTAEEFHLPAPGAERKEVGIDLGRLARAAVDFAVADPDVLPFPSGTFGVVVSEGADGEGPFPMPRALAEALRVRRPGGTLLVKSLDPAGRVAYEASGLP